MVHEHRTIYFDIVPNSLNEITRERLCRINNNGNASKTPCVEKSFYFDKVSLLFYVPQELELCVNKLFFAPL